MGKNRKSHSNNNTPRETYPDEQWESVKTMEDIENLTGYKITKDDKGNIIVTDEKYGTTIIFDKYYVSGAGRRTVNLKNDGQQAKDVGDGTNHEDLETYDFKDIIRIYNEAPIVLKESNGLIVFRKGDINNPEVGEHISRSSDHALTINPSAFGKKSGSDNLSKELYHEMAHGYDYHYNYHTSNDNIETYGLSYGNKKFQSLVQKPITSYINTYYVKGTSDYYKESFADAIGIVATYNNGNHNFTVEVPHKGSIPVKTWMNENKDLVKETNNIIKGNIKTISVDDFDSVEEYTRTEGYVKRWLSTPDNIEGVQNEGKIIW